jgi:hypothetical protein
MLYFVMHPPFLANTDRKYMSGDRFIKWIFKIMVLRWSKQKCVFPVNKKEKTQLFFYSCIPNPLNKAYATKFEQLCEICCFG